MLTSPQHLLLLAGREHHDVAVLVAEVDLAVGHEGRAPDRGEDVVRPEVLAGLGVEGSRGSPRGRRRRAMPSAIATVEMVRWKSSPPRCQTTALLGDVAVLDGVDRPEVADALAVLGVLADADVDLVVVDHRRGDDVVARCRRRRARTSRPWGWRRTSRAACRSWARTSRASRRRRGRSPAAAPDDAVGRVRPRAVEDLLARRARSPRPACRCSCRRR